MPIRELNRWPDPKAAARETDPETSWMAAKSVANIRDSQALVWSVLRQYGQMIDEKLVEFVDWSLEGRMSPSGVRTRRKELCDLGLVKDTGEKGKTRLGNPSTVWKAVDLETWRREQFKQFRQKPLFY